LIKVVLHYELRSVHQMSWQHFQ